MLSIVVKSTSNLVLDTLMGRVFSRGRKTLRSHGHYLDGGPRKIKETLLPHPSHAYFLLYCEEGLPYGMFLFGGRQSAFLDFCF